MAEQPTAAEEREECEREWSLHRAVVCEEFYKQDGVVAVEASAIHNGEGK